MFYSNKPVKLEDSNTHGLSSNPATELFIVEGDSAAGAVAGVRAVQFQAVLPMQGKPLNALKAKAAKVHGNPLFMQLSIALGVPLVDALQVDPNQADSDWLQTQWSGQLAALRFSRVNLLFDPDADGIHCGALMLMFFWRWMRPLLASGRIHMIRAPLFEMIAHKSDGELLVAHPDSVALSKDITANWTATGAAQIEIHHYRGLGSINADVLARTCVDPVTRQSTVVGLATAQSAIAVFAPQVAPPV